MGGQTTLPKKLPKEVTTRELLGANAKFCHASCGSQVSSGDESTRWALAQQHQRQRPAPRRVEQLIRRLEEGVRDRSELVVVEIVDRGLAHTACSGLTHLILPDTAGHGLRSNGQHSSVFDFNQQSSPPGRCWLIKLKSDFPHLPTLSTRLLDSVLQLVAAAVQKCTRSFHIRLIVAAILPPNQSMKKLANLSVPTGGLENS